MNKHEDALAHKDEIDNNTFHLQDALNMVFERKWEDSGKGKDKAIEGGSGSGSPHSSGGNGESSGHGDDDNEITVEGLRIEN